MPTTYKVLGQTSATAASAFAVANLVPDPLVNITSLSQANIGANTLVQLSSTGYTTAWRGMSETGTNQFYSGIDLWSTGSPNISWQGTNSLWVNNNSGSYNQMGFTTTGATTLTSVSFTGTGTLSAAVRTTNGVMPVTGSTTYYYGAYLNGGSNVTSVDFNFLVRWYASDGTFISNSVPTLPTPVANTWHKVSGSATSPSNAAYAVMSIWANMANSRLFGIDGIWFSTLASSTTTFPTPTTSALGNTTLTAPFNTRLTNVWSGTENLSTTINTYAGVLTDLYTVPSATSTVASTLAIANLGTTATTYRVLVLKSGETAAKKNFIAFDAPIGANSTDTFTLGMTLAAGDKIQVASDVADVSATLFGSEIS